MNAFEQWWIRYVYSGDDVYKAQEDAQEDAWNAALKHAAKICEERYAHYDGSKYDCYLNADECAEAIRKEISK